MVKDEPFLDEFVEYHLSEGFDFIHIVDDRSDPPVRMPERLSRRVKVWPAADFAGDAPTWEVRSQRPNIDRVYRMVRHESEWFAVLDADEYLCPRRNPGKTVAQELRETFSPYDCVKIPWVMMSSGGRQKDPDSLLLETRQRWNFDLRHPHPTGWHKGRCRYDYIEVKSVFRGNVFAFIDSLHCSRTPVRDCRCVDGVRCEPAPLDSLHPSLREEDISSAYLVCYHYRIISHDSIERKRSGNIDRYHVDLASIMAADYAEVIDETMMLRWERHLRKAEFKSNADYQAKAES